MQKLTGIKGAPTKVVYEDGRFHLAYICWGDCDRDVQTWCWECSFSAYNYIKCCNELPRLKHQFYSPQVLKVSVFNQSQKYDLCTCTSLWCLSISENIPTTCHVEYTCRNTES